MKTLLFVLIYLFVGSRISTAQIDPLKVAPPLGNLLVASAKSDQGSTSQEASKGGSSKAIEDYEKEKLARMKKYIGKYFMAVKTTRPPEFYASPDDLKKKIGIKEKEEFSILGVVQNQSGTMNFYKVRLESGKIGYLGADGFNLEIRIKDHSIMPVTKKPVKKKSPSVRSSQERATKAIELVKEHLIPSDPISKDKRSIERRMIEARATSLPNLKWRYEAKEIGNNKFEVTQYVEGESDRVITRIWSVDLSTAKVSPENPAARGLYR